MRCRSTHPVVPVLDTLQPSCTKRDLAMPHMHRSSGACWASRGRLDRSVACLLVGSRETRFAVTLPDEDTHWFRWVCATRGSPRP